METSTEVHKNPLQASVDEAEKSKDFQETAEQTKISRSLLIGTMNVRILIYVVAIFLPLYVEEKHVTLSSAKVGIMIGAVQLSNFLLSLPAGKLISFFGHKNFSIFGWVIIVVSCFGFAATTFIEDDDTFFRVALTCRFGIGAGTAIFNVCALAILSIEFEEARTVYLMAYARYEGLGILFGPIFGGVFFTLLGFGGAVLIVAITMLLSALLCFCWLPARLNDLAEVQRKRNEEIQREQISNSHNGLPEPEVGYGLFFRNTRSFMAICSSITSVYFATFLDSVISVELLDRGQNIVMICVAFLSVCIFYVGTIVIVGQRIHSLGARRISLFGCLVYLVSLSLIGPSAILHLPQGSTWLIFVAMCIHGIGFALLSASLMPEYYIGAELKLKQDRAKQGLPNLTSSTVQIGNLASSLLNTFKCLGLAFAPTIGGALTDKRDYRFACDVSLVLCTIYTVFYFFITFVCCNRPDESFSHDSLAENIHFDKNGDPVKKGTSLQENDDEEHLLQNQ